MKIAVGSENPNKISAVREAFERRFPSKDLIFIHDKVNSQVSSQPIGGEIKQGAYNRAKAIRELLDADYGVGLEGGTEMKYGDTFEYAWCAIVDRQGKVSYGHSFGIPMPAVLMHKIKKENKDLGPALDELLNTKDIAKKDGFFGWATGNQVTRHHGYMDMVLAALAPLCLPKYYKE